MSLAVVDDAPRALPRTAWRLLVMAAALLLVGGVVLAVTTALGLSAGPAIAPKNPFGTGLREAAPEPGGIGGYLLAVQSQFYRALTTALSAAKQGGGAIGSLVAIGFLYGVFHAAGPGHGKGVIAGYLVASRRTLARGLGLSLSAALLQAAVAIALVGVLAAALGTTAAAISSTANAVELASFGLLAIVGIALLWRKSGALVRPPATVAEPGHHHGHDHASQEPHAHSHVDGDHHHHDASCGCGHAHAPSAAEVERATTWRESAGIVLAAGLRPCSGAIVLLVFAVSQGLFWAGVAGTLAMALGTATTTGSLAALAVLARNVATRLAAGRGEAGGRIVAGLETLAAAVVALLGIALLVASQTGGVAAGS